MPLPPSHSHQLPQHTTCAVETRKNYTMINETPVLIATSPTQEKPTINLLPKQLMEEQHQPSSSLSLSKLAVLQRQQQQIVEDRLHLLNRSLQQQHKQHPPQQQQQQNPARVTMQKTVEKPSEAQRTVSPNREIRGYRKLSSLPIPTSGSLKKKEALGQRRCIFGHFWNNNGLAGSTTPTASFCSSSDDSSVSAPPSPPPATLEKPSRRRSASLSMPDTIQGRNSSGIKRTHRHIRTYSDLQIKQNHEEVLSTMRQFVPPSPRSRKALTSCHFLDIQQLPAVLQLTDLALPSLPSPLQRYYKKADDGTTLQGTTLGGAYPLMAPRPILRQSSYNSSTMSNTKEADVGRNIDNLRNSFNLTRTIHALECAEKITNRGDSSSSTSSSDDECSNSLSRSSSSASSNTCSPPNDRAVRFDPRVTVTEYEDNVKREWFSDSDLESFKCQTVALAQKYLMAHPELIHLYNRARLDPVTNTMRKKALFAMPALSAEGDDPSLYRFPYPPTVDASCSGNAASPQQRQRTEKTPESTPCSRKLEFETRAIQTIIRSEVKNILLVDPNKMVLDLFHRSIHPLFPGAHITAVQSGEEALQQLQPSFSSKQQQQRFDIIICEQRLARPPSRTSLHQARPSLQGLSCTELASLTEEPSEDSPSCSVERGGALASDTAGTNSKCTSAPAPGHVRHDSVPILSLAALGTMTPSWTGISGSEVFRQIKSIADAAVVPLLIGVSIRPDQDSAVLKQAGADLVWGKPPPLMNEQLRDEILTLLLAKRSRRQQQQRQEPECP